MTPTNQAYTKRHIELLGPVKMRDQLRPLSQQEKGFTQRQEEGENLLRHKASEESANEARRKE